MNTSQSEFNDLLARVDTLSLEQKAALHRQLEKDLQHASRKNGTMSEEELNQKLLAEGVYSHVPQAGSVAKEEWQPVDSDGLPISERIISERR